MSNHSQNIEIYRRYVIDFEVSPFESVDMLHRRSTMEKSKSQLTHEERMNLLNYDVQLINNAKRMVEHIGEIYDFSLSQEPLNEWWWHLDKVARGKVTFSLKPETDREFRSRNQIKKHSKKPFPDSQERTD